MDSSTDELFEATLVTGDFAISMQPYEVLAYSNA